MKKPLLVLMLILVSTSAMAGWVKTGEDDEFTHYADIATVRKFQGKAKVWRLIDYKSLHQANKYKCLSSKVQQEFDCKEEQVRVHAFSLFSKNMGAGKIVFSSTLPDDVWMPVAAEVNDAALFNIACGKK